MKPILFFLLIACVSIYASCSKRFDCSQNIHSFEAFYKAYPDKDSLQIGDTIWLELNAPTQLKDVATGQLVDFSGAVNFGPSIRYLEFTGGSIQMPSGIPAANSFENILIRGTTIQSDKPDQVRSFDCIEENNMYRFKVGIVPKKKGIFAIAPGDAAGVYRKVSPCDKAGFKLTFIDTDQHLYWYQNDRPGYQISDSEKSHGYCFKVY